MDKPPFPAWLRELIGIGMVLLSIAGAFFSLKSDLRSAREEQAQFSRDLSRVTDKVEKISERLPNTEAEKLRSQQMQKQIEDNHEWVKFEIAKLVKFKEETALDLVLIKKGVRE